MPLWGRETDFFGTGPRSLSCTASVTGYDKNWHERRFVLAVKKVRGRLIQSRQALIYSTAPD